MLKSKSILYLPFLLLMTNTSYGESFTKDVRAGKTTGLYSFWAYNRTTCYGSAFPQVRLKKPKHGKLIHRKDKARVPKGEPCAGKLAYRAVVFYTPDRGFRGKDNVSFTFSYPRFDGDTGQKRVTFKGVLNVK